MELYAAVKELLSGIPIIIDILICFKIDAPLASLNASHVRCSLGSRCADYVTRSSRASSAYAIPTKVIMAHFGRQTPNDEEPRLPRRSSICVAGLGRSATAF